jgi:hypothetical protein
MTAAAVTVDIRPEDAALIMMLVERGVEAGVVPMTARERHRVRDVAVSLQFLVTMYRAHERRQIKGEVR